MERPFYYCVRERPVGIVEVEVRPPVAFRPVDHLLPSVYQTQRTVFYIGVHSFRDDRLCRVAVQIHAADVYAFYIPAYAQQIKSVFVSQPFT